MNKQTSHRQYPFQSKNRYFNNPHDYPESFFFHTIPSFVSSFYQRKKRLPENISDWIQYDEIVERSQELLISWVGHASFLIQVGGINLLTDPIFGNASLFFPRILPPGIQLRCLPPIDVILLSHNHRDHCDVPSLLAIQKLFPHVKILVPKGNRQWLERKRLHHVSEYNWWDSYSLANKEEKGASVECVFLPAHHWSAQGIFDWNKSLWGSWMILAKGNQRSEQTVYFAGDTAYADHFKNIGQEFSHVTTALLPIAPGEPENWMRKSHLNSTQAVQAFIDLNAQQFIPMHWGTFPFGRDTFLGPIERLQTAWNLLSVCPSKKLTVVKVGQQLKI